MMTCPDAETTSLVGACVSRTCLAAPSATPEQPSPGLPPAYARAVPRVADGRFLRGFVGDWRNESVSDPWTLGGTVTPTGFAKAPRPAKSIGARTFRSPSAPVLWIGGDPSSVLLPLQDAEWCGQALLPAINGLQLDGVACAW